MYAQAFYLMMKPVSLVTAPISAIMLPALSRAVARASPGFSGGIVVTSSPYGVSHTSRPTTTGPVWFQKMDRNRDGEVSTREFLGIDDDFQKLDTNRDGLIDAAEAGRFE